MTNDPSTVADDNYHADNFAPEDGPTGIPGTENQNRIVETPPAGGKTLPDKRAYSGLPQLKSNDTKLTIVSLAIARRALAALGGKKPDESSALNGIGYGRKQRIQPPVGMRSGDVYYSEKTTYTVGCHLDQVLGNGRTVRFDTKDANFEISKTPDEANPNRGGKLLENAGGKVGPYLMTIVEVGTNSDTGIFGQQITNKYLDSEDIKNVVIRKGEPLTFGNNSNRPDKNGNPGRKITVAKPVTSVSSLQPKTAR